MTGWWRDRPDVRFTGRFLLLGVASGFALLLLKPIEPTLQRATVNSVVWASRTLGMSVWEYPGWYVEYGGPSTFGYIVSPACVGLAVVLLYGAAVVAFPTTWRNRLIGLGAGAALFFAVNVIRLVSLGWIGTRSRHAFDVVHIYGWGLFNVVVVATLWLGWASLVVGRPFSLTGSAGAGRRLMGALAGTAVFVALLVAGTAGPGIEIYGQVVRTIAASIASLFTGINAIFVDVPTGGLLGPYGFDYAFFAATMALFVATPQVSWWRTVKATLLIALPLTLLLHGAANAVGIASMTNQITGTSGSGTVMQVGGMTVSGLARTAQVALPVGAWLLWQRRSSQRSVGRGHGRSTGHTRGKQHRRPTRRGSAPRMSGPWESTRSVGSKVPVPR